MGAALALAWATVYSGCGSEDTPSAGPEERPPVSTPGPRPVLGIAEPNAWRLTPPPADPERIAKTIASLGARSHRFVVDWNVVEPQPPNGGHAYDFSAFDEMYEADVRHGIRPLLVLLNAPVWAADPGSRPGSLPNNPPAEERLGDWAEFVRAVATRYPDAIGIEVWNEPDLAGFWGTGSAATRPDPARYARLLEATFQAVKSVDEDLAVVGGALSANQPPYAPGDVPPGAFAERMFAAGASESMDALSLHPYPGSGGIEQTLALMEDVRGARDAAGAELSLWLTEIGISTTGPGAVPESTQGEGLAELCRVVTDQPDVGAVYLHNLIEAPGSRTSFEPGFGLIAAGPGGELRAKPAFAQVRRAFSSSRCGAGPR
jgi:polysaccharide biosynthesis protein PslG